ncbi:MAG: arginine--tRNA ligase [Bdellovibrionales bacterium]|nr:arginine--tRNA ligase [Bdellovibrionales bacterium]
MLLSIKEQSSFMQIKQDLMNYLKEHFKLKNLTQKIILEQPRHFDLGHLAWPVFNLAKQQKKSPQKLADEFSQSISASPPSFLNSCESLAGFVNFKFKDLYIQNHLKSLFHKKELSVFNLEKPEHLVLDFASPNVAKHMNVGHLRATLLGQVLVNLARAFGFKVTALNHLGDWGSQFGKLLWAYKEWGKEYDFKDKAFDSLVKLYIRFYESAESDKQKLKSAKEMFKKLEEGDQDLKELWQFFVELSVKNYKKYWDFLKVQHDLVLGESFYVPFMEDLKTRLREKNLLKPSEGAQVVFLKNSEIPCLISKSDGTSTYPSRDLCSIIYRFEKLKADLNIYITGSDQNLHFKQIFEVSQHLNSHWKNLHLQFGMYRFKGHGKMSTRRGKAVYIKDILKQTLARVEKIIETRNPFLEDKKNISKQIALGALIFNDLMQDRIKDVDFDWNKILDFEGNSGPFVQYSLVRARSLLKKSGFIAEENFQFPYQDKQEQHLAWLLILFESICFQSLDKLKPHFLARYLLDLSKSFNRFYNSEKIIGHSRQQDRLFLTKLTYRVLFRGLELLNIPRPQAM